MRKILARIAGTGAICALLIGMSAVAASASVNPGDGPAQPVNATVTLGTVLTVTGLNGTIAFGTVSPGQSVTLPNAEPIHVTTNYPDGATISLVNRNGGYKTGPGQGDILNDSATSIVTNFQPTGITLPNGASTVILDKVIPGDAVYPEAWTLAVPADTTGTGSLTAAFELDVFANA